MDVTGAIRIASLSDVGLVRAHNEDAVASDLTSGLVMLADGMGGHQCGEVASAMASLIIKTELSDLFAKQQADSSQALSVSGMLEKVVMLANDSIAQTAQELADCEGMGTTLVCGVFADNKIVVGHIGDSRMYRLRDDAFVQLTEDHSVLQAQINAGLMTKAEARHSNNKHLVTRALGTSFDAELELCEHGVQVGDVYLLCSDGLTDLVDDDEVKNTIISANGDINLAVKQLLTLANTYGGNDNISMLIALVEKPFAIK
jgi:PPM family protein phosphatase